MKLLLVTLYDAKAGAYNVPQYVQSIGGAVRAFSDEINRSDPGNVLFNHPDDFLLFELGTYDDQTAQFEPLQPMRLVASGVDFKGAR